MTIQELKLKLSQTNIPSDCYSIIENSYSINENGLPNEALCLAFDNNKWIVYYSERGSRTGLKEFDNESDACINFFKTIKLWFQK